MFKERWYQSECEASIFEYFKQGNKGNPVCVLPTGTGKSVIIANFVRRVLREWPSQRIMMLTHVKELIEQNAEKLQRVWPTAPLGIYSAGLNSRDTAMPILFAGVQSVAKAIKRSESDIEIPVNMRHFGHRDLIIIDECHLLSPAENSQYQFVIKELLKINPSLKVIGFTATPYRLKQGMITEDDGIFTDICYDVSGVEAFNKMIAEGFLVPLIPKRTLTEIDVSHVTLTGGEFNNKQLQAAVDKDETTYNAVKEIVQQGQNRNCWLVFASGVDNAEHVAEVLRNFGVSAAAVHSKLPDGENNKRMADFKSGKLRALVNNNKLTTGFDHPPVDLIGMLRPTMSPGLWVQMLGRGTRPSPKTGKRDCLVLDFAGNTQRLGPINDPVKPRKPGKGEAGEVPIRICEVCGVYNHASARRCCNCGTEFAFETKIVGTSSDFELLRDDIPIVKYLDVTKVMYASHDKKGAPLSMKVSYVCGLRMFNEWVCLEHGGLPARKARAWWSQRYAGEPPATTEEAMLLIRELRVPTKIRVWVNKQFPEILSHEF